ncbi:protein phosphatase 1 regulatory subunit 14B [Grammomys surdaster]|uniref:protein phosphatase 1 regulatory subunit 14B n=1 Tax=Grammomys surdaster TaxID=491861 RepID=UPI00109F72BC|nr:protein phosphatase 1 regulatory subunit 14B [Grammomys surdaster]
MIRELHCPQYYARRHLSQWAVVVPGPGHCKPKGQLYKLPPELFLEGRETDPTNAAPPAALAAPAPGPGSGSTGPRVYFQSPPGAAGEGPGGADDDGPVRRQGKVTVKYDRKELRKRLNLEEWILEQLTRLYDCQEEEIPELEIDVDELLDMESDDTRAARVKELLVDCYKPTEAFISGLLDKIRGMQKLSTPQKK